MKKCLTISALGTALAMVTAANAATLSVGAVAPTSDGADISNFTSGGSDALNVSGGGDDFTYVAGNRPAQGQSFTTGSDLSGYLLTSITVQHRDYSAGFNDDFQFGTLTVRVGTVLAGTFSLISSDSVAITNANGLFSDAGGEYLTFTFDTPIALAANTVYGFDWDNPGGYFEMNGTSSDVYAGGSAYNSGAIGDATATDLTGDRVFHVDLAVIPEPSIALLGGLGVLGLLRRRRG